MSTVLEVGPSDSEISVRTRERERERGREGWREGERERERKFYVHVHVNYYYYYYYYFFLFFFLVISQLNLWKRTGSVTKLFVQLLVLVSPRPPAINITRPLPGGKFYVTGGTDKIVRVYEMNDTPLLVNELTGHSDRILTIQFNNNGQWYVHVQVQCTAVYLHVVH